VPRSGSGGFDLRIGCLSPATRGESSLSRDQRLLGAGDHFGDPRRWSPFGLKLEGTMFEYHGRQRVTPGIGDLRQDLLRDVGGQHPL